MPNTSSAVLTISIDSHADVPLYLQVQRKIEELINDGRLLPGDRLPSSRELASSLGISRTSSVKAVDNLVAEGILTSVYKKGVFVSQSLPNMSLNNASTKEGSILVSESRKSESAINRFDSGSDTSVFPNRIWAKCMRNAWLNPQQDLMQGYYAHGLPELKLEISLYLQKLRGLNCSPEQIIVTAGNRDALTILSHSLLKLQTQNVWLENPTYPQIPALFKWLEKPIRTLNVDSEGSQTPLVNSHGGIAVLTPCRQYPLGTTMSSVRRQEWLNRLAEQRKMGKPIWVIEDDYDNEFLYQGRSPVPLMQQDKSQSTFFVGSFSKVMFRGLRLGFIVAPLEQVDQLKRHQDELGMVCAMAAQPALAEFMKSGAFVTHLRRMRRHYLQKRNLLNELLNPLESTLDWHLPNGGMHICAMLMSRSLAVENELIQRAKSLGLYLNPLSQHYITTPKKAGFILGYSQPSDEDLKRNCEILNKAIGTKKGS